MFSQHFNTVLTTDEHVIFYLNYHSVGNLTMYYYIFGRLLSFKHIKLHKFTLFLIYMYCRLSQTFCYLKLFHLIYLPEVNILYRKATGFPVAQMVEHGASNAKIMGSIPRESKS